jgi:hypothetical protein
MDYGYIAKGVDREWLLLRVQSRLLHRVEEASSRDERWAQGQLAPQDCRPWERSVKNRQED